MPGAVILARTREDADTVAQGLGSGYQVKTAVVPKGSPTRSLIRTLASADVLFIDMRILGGIVPGGDYGAWFKELRTRDPAPEIVILTPKELIREVVRCIKSGAGDYLTLPIYPDEVRLVAAALGKSLQRRNELAYLRRQVSREGTVGMLETHNPRMQAVLAKVEAVAPARTTVLLLGETGTGKGLLAKLIHGTSQRVQAPFVGVHCGAIPDALVESELFGHEKGAFTGAVRKKLGKFEIARGGTIFLDEVGTLTPPAQIKLLQVLQERTFSRVGGEREIPADVRVIAAANTDLGQLSRAGEFRQDLYYRLNVFPIELPPLRERVEDLPLLADFFLGRLERESPKGITEVAPEARNALARYPWPGNIRELENIMERAYILENSSRITAASLPPDLTSAEQGLTIPSRVVDLPLAKARRRVVEEFETQYLKELLTQHQGRIDRSAAQAGISTRQLHKLLLRYGIHKEDYKNRR